MASIRYFVRDVEAAKAFYVTGLGFDVIEEWGPAFAIVGHDDLQLWLSGPGSSAARPMPDGRHPESGGWNRIVIETDDLPATIARVQVAGGRFRNEIISGPGGSQILAEDPDGNPIELFSPAAR
jgi:catechol 2,3-dioxygenase-like lactoylglutathione lyase family enzyme